MELVNIIDENGNILYKVSKDQAHAKGLLHKTITAQLIDSQGRWILVKQAPHKQDAGQFVCPAGGHIRSGENELDALAREVQEELGLKDFKRVYKGKMMFDRFVLNRQENHLVSVYEIYTDALPILNEEAVEYKAFTIKEIKKHFDKNPATFGDAFHVLLKNLYLDLLP